MWTCRDVTERASDHLERRLGPAEGAALRAHLGICPHCRRYLTQFARMIGMLRRLPAEPVDEAAEARLLSLLRGLPRA